MLILTPTTRFSPKKYKVALWIDGNDPLNAAAPANNTSLSGISNKGSSAISFAQATAGNQAKYMTNVSNGNGVIRTDGNDFYTASNSFTFGTSFTIFLVATPSSSAASYYYATNNPTGGGPAIISKFTNGAVQNYEFYDLSPDRIILSTAGTGLNICEATQTDGVNLTGRFNGAVAGTLTPTKSANGFGISWLFSTSSTAPTGFTIDLASLIIATPALTTTQATDIRKYLSDKWAVAIS